MLVFDFVQYTIDENQIKPNQFREKGTNPTHGEIMNNEKPKFSVFVLRPH